MKPTISENAQSILQAGLSAAGADRSSQAFLAADRAVQRAVAHIGLNGDPAGGNVRMIENLIEIAQLHVRQQLSQ